MTVLTVADIMSQDTKGTSYLWGSFIPEKSIILLSGEAGVGKTTFAYNLAVHAAKGEAFCGMEFSKPINVLYADLETATAVRRTKLELVSEGKPPDNLYFITALDFVRQFQELEHQVKERGIELLVVDTINEAFSTKDEQDNAEANRQFSYVKRLRDETGCSVILMHHIGKGQPGKKVYSARGASARAAAADVVLNLTSMTDDTVCLEKAKDRIAGGKDKLYLGKAGEDNFEVIEQGEDQEAPALIRAQAFILDLLSKELSHRFEFNEEGRRQGISEATIGRALDRLVRAGKLVRVKKGIYTLPSPHPSPLIREDPRLIGLNTNQSAQNIPLSNVTDLTNSPKNHKNTDDSVEQILGMSVAEALSVWKQKGEPPIPLGPGQNCFNLVRLLHSSPLEKHLRAVAKWLRE